MRVRILSIDVGTTESAYALMDHSLENPLIKFGKIPNEEIVTELVWGDFGVMAYEEFASYGMPIGQSTMRSIWWNGYYCRVCDQFKTPYKPVLRKDVKMHLCGTMKAKDCNIRQALIDKYGEPGTKKNPGILHGVSKDVWSAIAINVTYWEVKDEM
jgi:hypothetical protein